MENLLLLRIELFFLISSLLYIVYYIIDYTKNVFGKLKKIVAKAPEDEEKEVEVVTINKEEKTQEKMISEFKEKRLNEEDKNKISEIIKRVRLNIEKGYFDKAKSLIIEGLTLDKFNKDLNLELGEIYEQEENYKNAELIYKDISLVIQDNSAILSKLAYVYSMQGDYKEAIKTYEEVHNKKQSNMEIVESLAYLNFEIQDYHKALKYFKMALKEKPKNVEMLRRKAISYEKIKKLKEALKSYEEILFIRPYDEDARENVKRLELYVIEGTN